MKTEERSFRNFTRIEVNHGIEVKITQSSDFHLAVTTQKFSLKDVTIEQDVDRLVIGRRRFSIRSWFASPSSRVIVDIAMPELAELALKTATQAVAQGFGSQRSMTLKLSGASRLDLLGVSAGTIRINLSGASRLSGELAGESVLMEIRGASTLNLKGSANNIQADASGACRFELDGFTVQAATVTLKGASSGAINVKGVLNATLSDASRLSYGPDATLGKISVSGASSLTRMGEPAVSSR